MWDDDDQQALHHQQQLEQQQMSVMDRLIEDMEKHLPKLKAFVENEKCMTGKK